MNQSSFAARSFCFALLLLGLNLSAAVSAQSVTYDVVLKGGRVMDPETGLDAIRNVGIRGDQVAEISENELSGVEIVDVRGLVVAPGFVDLHAHGQSNRANEFQAHDGVTTALELESGRQFVGHWIASREGKALINYGASVSHPSYRALNMNKYAEQARRYRETLNAEGAGSPNLPTLPDVRYEGMSQEESERMFADLERELQNGGLGIGVPVGYYPGATRDEIFRVFQFAAANSTIIFSHIREMRAPAFQEFISNAAQLS